MLNGRSTVFGGPQVLCIVKHVLPYTRGFVYGRLYTKFVVYSGIDFALHKERMRDERIRDWG